MTAYVHANPKGQLENSLNFEARVDDTLKTLGRRNFSSRGVLDVGQSPRWPNPEIQPIPDSRFSIQDF